MWGFAPRYTPPKAADPAKTPAPVAAPAPAPEVREQRELDNLADLVAVTVELAEKVGVDLVLRDGSVPMQQLYNIHCEGKQVMVRPDEAAAIIL